MHCCLLTRFGVPHFHWLMYAPNLSMKSPRTDWARVLNLRSSPVPRAHCPRVRFTSRAINVSDARPRCDRGRRAGLILQPMCKLATLPVSAAYGPQPTVQLPVLRENPHPRSTERPRIGRWPLPGGMKLPVIRNSLGPPALSGVHQNPRESRVIRRQNRRNHGGLEPVRSISQ